MTATRPRAGFTLVEMLAVIGILALLAALTAAGIGKVRAAQMQRISEQTVIKLQLAIDQQFKAAVADQAMRDRLTYDTTKIPLKIRDDTNNTGANEVKLDRAAALWAYILAKREFPQNFQEALTTNVNIGGSGGSGGYAFQPRKTFSSVPNLAPTVQPEDQAAHLLYLIITEKGSSGMNTVMDEATQSAQGEVKFAGATGSYRVFTDAWGTPISFRRLAEPNVSPTAQTAVDELNQPPYVRGSGTDNDSLDPKGLLRQLGGTAKTAYSTVFPPGAVPGTPNQSGAASTWFTGRNNQPAVFSAGLNRNVVNTAPLQLWNPGHTDGQFGGDNLVGVRLRRQGNRGD